MMAQKSLLLSSRSLNGREFPQNILKKEDVTINDLIKKYGIVAVLLASTIVIISEFLDDYGRCIFYIFFGLFIMWAYVSF